MIGNLMKTQGLTPDRFLEPSAGIGQFLDAFADSYQGKEFVGFENDLLTGRILRNLHPTDRVFVEGFETISKHYNNYFDVIASNIPFGSFPVFDAQYHFLKSGKENETKKQSLKLIHNYFFVKGLDTLREGGILSFITSQGLMDSPMNAPIRQYLMEHADLISAVRLPNKTFNDHAGTEVGTDLIVLQKNSLKKEITEREKLFVGTTPISSKWDIRQNSFYVGKGEDHGFGQAVCHEVGFGTDLYGNMGQILTFHGGIEKIATEAGVRMNKDFRLHLNMDSFDKNRLNPRQSPKAATMSVQGETTAVVRASAVRQFDPFVKGQAQGSPQPTAISGPQPDLRRRRQSRKQDLSGMLDLFSQPNLPIEETAAYPIEPENFDERPYSEQRLEHYKEGTLVIDRQQIGFLKDVFPDGASFQPLRLNHIQTTKAQKYILLRDAYEQLYSYEATRFEEHKPLRDELNYAYKRFVNLYGDLNKKDNAKLILTDPAGRDILSLERFVDQQKTLADVFDHPVAFSTSELTHVDTSDEALAASLNIYAKVNLRYMAALTGKAEHEILSDLGERLYYDPFDAEYQIADQFIAGNVVAKVERFRQYLNNHPDDARVKRSLESLEQAIPQPVTFEELDFNFGERWIPTGLYSQYASYLFGTAITVSYQESIDTFHVSTTTKNAQIKDKYAVKATSRTFDGIALLQHALHNTTPHITKTEIVDGIKKVSTDHESIQLANMQIDKIRQGFTDWIQTQGSEFKTRITDLYNSKFNCFVRPNYDGSFQTFPGLDMQRLKEVYGITELYDSQKNAI